MSLREVEVVQQPKSVNIKRLDPNHEAEVQLKKIFDNEHNNNNSIDAMKLRSFYF